MRLLIQHMPYHELSDKEYDRLTDELREIERLFLSIQDGEVRAYYQESLAPEPARDSQMPGSVARPVAQARDGPVAHLVMLQAQLMEQVFYALLLDHYANAPDNRGWVNLFRRWGRSPTFNHHFDSLRAVFTPALLDFYDAHLRYQPKSIDNAPVPHPWDLDVWRVGGPRAKFLDAGIVEARARPGVPWGDEGDVSTERPKEGATAEAKASQTGEGSSGPGVPNA